MFMGPYSYKPTFLDIDYRHTEVFTRRGDILIIIRKTYLSNLFLQSPIGFHTHHFFQTPQCDQRITPPTGKIPIIIRHGHTVGSPLVTRERFQSR